VKKIELRERVDIALDEDTSLATQTIQLPRLGILRHQLSNQNKKKNKK
jgi:hypothetical protein